MRTDYDLIILGGGCAGLSLAMRLAALGPRCPRTLIIEARPAYGNDRTWCFWGEPAAPLRHLVEQRWHALTIHTDGGQVRVDCSAMPYQRISAGAFYAEALTLIGRTAAITLRLGEALASNPRKAGGSWHMETRQGPVRAARVVDTRATATPRSGAATLWQSFYGHEIACSEDLFDPACVALMDFRHAAPQRIEFTYVLPLSARHALVEVTQFGPQPLGPSQLRAALERAIAGRTGGAACRVLRSEHGILPMGLHEQGAAADPTYVHAGIMQGAARPATGYAFQRIQRWAARCAERLGEGGLPLGHALDAALLRALDALFLSLLRARPDIAPALFLRLFEAVDSACLTRFLSDQGSLADCARIVAALPAGPFLRQLPVALVERAGRRRAASAS
ncbi:lycopene cyclase family protein [Massilia sp. PWRC2]|uniref:lycopene cyclase family protein n=1 Tax=Massilia sp. PWRC2 TaxID=2804626 RepID=UPI003CF3DBA2